MHGKCAVLPSKSTLAIRTTVVPIRILIRTTVVPIRILIRTTVVPIRILIRTTGITNTLCLVYNYGYRLASINDHTSF